jgi:hypothetical protein
LALVVLVSFPAIAFKAVGESQTETNGPGLLRYLPNIYSVTVIKET